MGLQHSKITSHDRAILEMKVQRDKLRQFQKRIVIVLDREQEIARQCMKMGDKRRALLALRKKKYQESLLEKTDEQLSVLEQLTSSIEFAAVEKDVLYGLSQGNQVLKTLQKEMSLEKVERIIEESADAIAYQEEISRALSTAMTSTEESEALEEFARLQETNLPDLPEVPTNRVNVQETNHSIVNQDLAIPQMAA